MKHPLQLISPLAKWPAAAALITALLLTAGCGSSRIDIWRVLPIQLGRVTQTESYQQRFIFKEDNNQNLTDLSAEQQAQLDARLDQTFNILLGAKNWQHLKNLYGVDAIRTELFGNAIHIDGLMNFTAYLDPESVDYAIIEGSGRFFTIRENNGEILQSGDFHIEPQRYKLSAIQSGCIPVETTIFTTRIPGKTTYYKNALIQYDLYFKKIKNDKRAFTIDYDRPHPSYIDLNGDGHYDSSEHFADLIFNGRHHQAKIFDFAGLNFIKDDYRSDARSAAEAKLAAQEDKSRPCISLRQGD